MYIDKIETDKAEHAYEVYTPSGIVFVCCYNRAQARRLVENKGYIVDSVNMVG